jgi:hypothetical protein
LITLFDAEERLRESTTNMARFAASLCVALRKKAQGSDRAVIQEKIKSLKRFSHPEDSFQLELVQNAVDAGATHIVILTSATSFELLHNGKRFTAKDIEALSSTGLSAKGTFCSNADLDCCIQS